MKIKSDLDLINKAYKGKLALSEVSVYLENKYSQDVSQLELLKVEVLQFKMDKVVKKIKELQDEPKYIAMKLNYEVYGKKMPFITFMLEPKNEKLTDIEYYDIMHHELECFIDEFLPTQFIGLISIDIMIKSMMKRNNQIIESQETIPSDIPIVNWKGNQVNFYEVFKGLIESGLISIEQNEEKTFDYLKEIFNLPQFNINGARHTSKKRLENVNIYDFLSSSLQKWR